MADLPRSTQILLALRSLGHPGPALDIASHQGALAREVGGTYIDADLTACEAAWQAGIHKTLHTDLLPAGKVSTIFFDAREYDPAFAAETIAQAAARLTPDGILITTAPPEQLATCFAQVEEQGEAAVGRSPLRGITSPTWTTYETSFAGRSYTVQTGPGVFSPRGLDLGTQVMLEQIEAAPGARFLDLGCGVGIVSKIASEAWGCQVTAVDVNARALRLTGCNAPRAEVLASDGFRHLGDRQFDLIASNPPYHTDFAVAKAFIEGAFAHLAPGGSLYLVVKRSDWYIQKVRNIFGGCRLVEQQGYTTIIAEKRQGHSRPATPPPPATTRKHAKRMAATSSKRHRRP